MRERERETDTEKTEKDREKAEKVRRKRKPFLLFLKSSFVNETDVSRPRQVLLDDR